MRPFGAQRKTLSAAYTPGWIKFYLRPDRKGLRIMAPRTAATAALKKHRGPYSGPIMNREALYIKYNTSLPHEYPLLSNPADAKISG
jgi:hypothetical protein